MAFIKTLELFGYFYPLTIYVLVFAFACLLSYKWGRRDANRAWRWDVQHMPQVIGQDVREAKDREIALLRQDNDRLREERGMYKPAVRGSMDLLRKVAK